MKLLSFGKVENGSLKLDNEKKFRQGIRIYEGKRVLLTVERKSKKRSNNQNRYYFGVVIDLLYNEFISKGHQITRETIHEILKYKFLQTELINNDSGEILKYTKSTSDLTTTEFMDYIASIQQYATETFGIYIPDPHEFLEA